MSLKRADRNAVLIATYQLGYSQTDVAQMFGLTRSRVNRLIKCAGIATHAQTARIHSKPSPKQIRILSRQSAEDNKRARFLAKWGYEPSYVASLADCPMHSEGHPLRKFIAQRRNARKRGVVWSLTFREWWEIWAASGFWQLRGRGDGYCMARFGDVGPYAVDNVEIITCAQNTRDSFISRPAAIRAKRPSGHVEAPHVA